MPRVAKKALSSKGALPLEPLVDQIAAIPPPLEKHGDALIEPSTPAHSPTRPHIGVVEADVGELLDKAWLTVGSNLEANDVDHYAIAAELMKAADGQDAAALEEAFLRVCSTYGKETLGRVSDKILIYTVQKGWSGACKLCVEYNADVNAQDEDNGGSPLMYAIHNSHDHIVDILLQLGAGMDQFEQQGYTPLMVACLSDNAAACERLLKNNTDLDQTDSKGRTALSMACRYGSLECVKVLTTAGANVSHRDEDGMTVLEHAEQNDRKQVVTLIKRAQLANQMRQRRKQKTQQKDTGMTSDEYDRRAQEAQARADALLAELDKEEEVDEAKKARVKAKRMAKKEGKKATKRKEVQSPETEKLNVSSGPVIKTHVQDGDEETTCSSHKAQQQQKGKQQHDTGQDKGSRKGGTNGRLGSSGKGHLNADEGALDKFGCTVQEAAELGSYQRVMLQGRVSPDEAVWQWCADGAEIDPEKLRKMWEFMVDAGANHSTQEQEPAYLNILTVLMDVCTVHKVSIKQGKKVKQRLEKIGPIREELQAATRPPLSQERLEAAIAAARAVVGMLEVSLLEHAKTVAARIAEIGEEAASAEMAGDDEESSEEESEPEPEREPKPRGSKPAPAAPAQPQAPLRRQAVLPPQLPAVTHVPAAPTPRPPPRALLPYGRPEPPALNAPAGPSRWVGAELPPGRPLAGRTAGVRPSLPSAMNTMSAFPPLSVPSSELQALPEVAPPPPPDPQQHLLGASLVDALDGSPTAQALKPPADPPSKPTWSAPPPAPSPPPAARVPAPSRIVLDPGGSMPSGPLGTTCPSFPRTVGGFPRTAGGITPGVMPPRPPPLTQSGPLPPPRQAAAAIVPPPRPRNGVNPLGFTGLPTDESGSVPGGYDSANSLCRSPFPGSSPDPYLEAPACPSEFDVRRLRLSTHAEPFTPAASSIASVHAAAYSMHPRPKVSFVRPLQKGLTPSAPVSVSDPVLPVALGGHSALPLDPFRMNSPPPPGRLATFGNSSGVMATRRGLSINGVMPAPGGLTGSPARPALAAVAASPRAGVDEAFYEQMLGDLLDDD